MSKSLLIASLLALPGCMAAKYTLADTYNGTNFFSKFDFFTGGDPTDGWVDYVDYDTAVASNLIPQTNVANWGVDIVNSLNPSSSAGRPSIRLTSKATYNHGLFIADIQHMPSSTCGLWPAYWFLGQNGNWPNSGELDVIEGVNNVETNLISGHTKLGCTITGSDTIATLETTNCAVPNGTTGCTFSDPRSASYGSGFNANGGGVYAVLWTSAGINVWFFQRQLIPYDIQAGNPNPAGWGEPTAVFAGSCDIDDMFFDMSIVFDTTFCGQWAGNVYGSMGCPMYNGQASWPSCVTYVAENPGAFSQAYWYINYIDVYNMSGGAPYHAAAESKKPALSPNITTASVAMGMSTTGNSGATTATA